MLKTKDIVLIGACGAILASVAVYSLPVVYRQAAAPFTPYAVSDGSGCHSINGRLPWLYRTQKVMGQIDVPLRCFPASERKLVIAERHLAAALGGL